MTRAPDTSAADPAGKKTSDAAPAQADAPGAKSVRECSDRVARMERDLAELRERLERVQVRRASVLASRDASG